MSEGTLGLAGLAVLFGIVVADDIDNDAFQSLTKDNVTIRIDEKERVQNGDSSKYIVWGTHMNGPQAGQQEVFKNEDSYWLWKLDSSDVQGALKEGHTYNVDVAEWRIHWLSEYRNITSTKSEIKEVTAPALDAPATPGQ